jgi:hypothetical protein
MPARQTPAPKPGETEITIRVSRNLLGRIDRWIGSQDEAVSRPAAILRLAETGLQSAAISSKGEGAGRGAKRAAGMASDMIDHLGDQSATAEDREQRKRRLVKGPSEFREMREERAGARRKR